MMELYSLPFPKCDVPGNMITCGPNSKGSGKHHGINKCCKNVGGIEDAVLPFLQNDEV
jgi:hypothetical protein